MVVFDLFICTEHMFTTLRSLDLIYISELGCFHTATHPQVLALDLRFQSTDYIIDAITVTSFFFFF